MKHLVIDTEQEAILRQLIPAIAAFLTARSTRRDPLGMISKAYKLQERKCANMQFQLDQDPIATWPDLNEDAKSHFTSMVTAYAGAKNPVMRELLYAQMYQFMSAQRAKPTSEKRSNSQITGAVS